MNRLDRPRAPVDLVLAAHDILRARAEAIAARNHPAGEQRGRKVDRVVAVGGEHFEPGLRDRGGGIDSPPHDRNVFLFAVNQLDILRGEGGGDEMQLAATGDQHQKGQCAAHREVDSGGSMAGNFLSRGHGSKPMHGDERGSEKLTARKPQARTMLGSYAKSRVPERGALAIVPQIWETMIRMSQADCRVFWAICMVVLLSVASCCRGDHP